MLYSLRGRVLVLLIVVAGMFFASTARAAEIVYTPDVKERGFSLRADDSSATLALWPFLLEGAAEETVVSLETSEPQNVPDGFKAVSQVITVRFSGALSEFAKPYTLALPLPKDSYQIAAYLYDPSNSRYAKWTRAKKTSTQFFVEANFSYANIVFLDVMPDNGLASWYRYKKCDCAASPKYSKGTKLRVVSQEADKFVDVVVNDFGPDQSIFPERVIDLDATAFKKLSSTKKGIISVLVYPL